ncbi:primosomal replication protein PriC [Franconibacter helveticus]|uniref:primosomal replication protein PriC n=1 Tax=Franconibacter helveticus TaxID=357240 RepID=UPI00066CE299|nr:primosomal replication protein PriC [Franconibacter helveticus]MDU6925304.1 primosomal replication protein PriC [Franconibacter helveticus]
MKTALLLQSLQAHVAQLAALLAPLAPHQTLSPRFDRQLFRARTTRIGDYLAEIKTNLAQLEACVAQNHTEQVAWLAQRLAEQIAALQREAATWPLRRYDSAHLAAGRMNARLLQHQDYERRLMMMKNEREQRLAQETTLNGQQRLQREVEALNGRLERCRAALMKIENALSRMTR